MFVDVFGAYVGVLGVFLGSMCPNASPKQAEHALSVILVDKEFFVSCQHVIFAIF